MPDDSGSDDREDAAADEMATERQATDDANEAARTTTAESSDARTYGVLDRDPVEPLPGDADERVRRVTGDDG
jgi:hypothetical protein